MSFRAFSLHNRRNHTTHLNENNQTVRAPKQGGLPVSWSWRDYFFPFMYQLHPVHACLVNGRIDHPRGAQASANNQKFCKNKFLKWIGRLARYVLCPLDCTTLVNIIGWEPWGSFRYDKVNHHKKKTATFLKLVNNW